MSENNIVKEEIQLTDQNKNKMFSQKNKENYIPQVDDAHEDETSASASASDSQNLVQEKEGTTAVQAFSSLCKAGIGTGLLFTPLIVKQCGFFMSAFILIVIPFLIYMSYMHLIHVLNNQTDSKLTMLQAVSKLFKGGSDQYQKKNFTSWCIFIFNIGGNIAFFILVLNSIGLFLKTEEDEKQYGDAWTPSTMQRTLISIFIVFPIYYPFALQPNLGDLHFFNLFGLFINGMTYTLIIINSLYLIFFSTDDTSSSETHSQQQQGNEPESSVLYSILLNFGVIMYLFDINGVISDVRGEMSEPKKFQDVLKKYLGFMSSISFVIGALGYIGYGDNTQANFFSNLHSRGILKGYGDILASCYSFSLIINAVLYIYPVTQILEKKFIKVRKTSDDNIDVNKEDKSTKVKKHLIRFGCYVFQIFFAIVFPNIESVVSILGCVFSVCLGFVIPYLLYQKYFGDHPSMTKPYKDVQVKIVVGLGILLGFLGLIATIQ